MVFLKVRETYDLHTTTNKMTIIGIHTPKPDIIKRNYPGMLMQCRAYRPVSADVRVACASVMPLDPLGVGTTSGDVAPEDVFNPILYKAMSNKGMSQLEARINMLRAGSIAGIDIDGSTAAVDVDDVTGRADEFNIYYGLLSNTHDWKHANPQAGLSMTNLKPFVYEMVYNVGDSPIAFPEGAQGVYSSPNNVNNGNKTTVPWERILGNAKPFPFLNCTSYTFTSASGTATGYAESGFSFNAPDKVPSNSSLDVPYLPVFVGCIIVPPSRLHELFYRMVVEWTLEFTSIRPIGEITNWGGLEDLGSTTHYQNYSYAKVKEAVTGDSTSELTGDSCMVSANVEVNKVM